MKLELKTKDENYSKSFSYFLGMVFIFTFIIILGDAVLKLGSISKHYEIDFNCRLLSVEKSTSNFKKLSRLSNLKSKQQIWEFCKEFVK
tara:strand:+ start:158 stop:424 length:267 start_codon:yes stop_codon:yes gene_type:complete